MSDKVTARIIQCRQTIELPYAIRAFERKT
jgi:hypothetical protein